jgi:hypothetical protein
MCTICASMNWEDENKELRVQQVFATCGAGVHKRKSGLGVQCMSLTSRAERIAPGLEAALT